MSRKTVAWTRLAGAMAGLAYLVVAVHKMGTARDQRWFWTPEWQAREREADEDILAGRVTRHATDDDFLKALAGEPPGARPGKVLAPL